jgi:hypothetical protein
MSMKWMRRVALAAGLATFGCGTMANLDGRLLPVPGPSGQVVSTPFGGVRRDIVWAKTAESTAKLRYVADLPLSLVGDLVTLPKTVIGAHSDALLQDHDTGVSAAFSGTPATAAANP